MRLRTLGWVLLAALAGAVEAQAQASWLLPETSHAAAREAIGALMAGDPARGLRALPAADAEPPPAGGEAALSPVALHYLRALMLAAAGQHREALAATDKGVARGGERNSRDQVRLVLLRGALYTRLGDPMSGLVNLTQVPPVAETVFGGAHPATTFARVVESLLHADVYARPQSLESSLARLAEAHKKLTPQVPGRLPEGGGEEFLSRALLFQAAGQLQLQRRQFGEARRLFETALGFLIHAGRAPAPTADTLRLIGILTALDDDRLIGMNAVAAAYAKDADQARILAAASAQRAYRLGGVERARWVITGTMNVARTLGDCQAAETLVGTGVEGRDGQLLRAHQLREIGGCWTVVAKDPARAQPFFDAAQACTAGESRCPP